MRLGQHGEREALGFDVEGDAALVGGVEGPEEAVFGVGVVVVEGADASCVVAPGGFDFDDVGGEVAEDASAEGAATVG